MNKYTLVLILLLTTYTLNAQEKTPFKDATDVTQDIATRYFTTYMAMDWDKLETMLHVDATFEDPTAALLFGEKKPSGKQNVIKNFREGYASLTSMKAKLSRTFFSGDTGIFELDLTFGFRNRQNGITTINMPLVVIITVKDGKVIKHRDYGDYREYVKQLKAAQAKPAPGNPDKEAVRQAVLDYVEGIYNVEPARIERSVHTKLAKIGYYKSAKETEYRPGANMTFAELVETAKTFNKAGKLPKDAPKEIDIYEVLDQIATVRLTAVWGIDYIHLAKIEGKWMIVNVIWQSLPSKG